MAVLGRLFLFPLAAAHCSGAAWGWLVFSPLYGDVFAAPQSRIVSVDLDIDRHLWGAMESDESESESEEEDDGSRCGYRRRGCVARPGR